MGKQQQQIEALGGTQLKEQRRKILGKWAYGHLLENSAESANNLSHESACKIVTEVGGFEGEAANEFLLDLAKETGLISEGRRKDSWMFL